MKRYGHLPILAFLLITTLIFVSCGTKETLTTQSKVDASQAQIPDENKISRSQSTDAADNAHSPEAELADKRESPEAKRKDKPRTSPEAELADKRESPEADTSTPKPETDVVLPKIDIPDNSVLHLIPETTLGVIYCPSLMELDESISAAALQLIPQPQAPTSILAQILAESFEAGFENLDELEQIGLDMNKDFAVFFPSIDPMFLSAFVHLTDTDAMMEVIEAEAEGSVPTQYHGVTYWSTVEGDGNFVILDNILVFSQIAEVCEDVIDVHNEKKSSISQNPDYAIFLRNVVEGNDQISAIFQLESTIAPFSEELNQELESMIDSFQSDPDMMNSVPVLDGVFTMIQDAVQELKSISLTLQIDGTDVRISPFLKFSDEGKIQDVLKKMVPNQLAFVNDLPNEGFMFGGFEGNAKSLFEWGMSWMQQIFPGDNLENKKMFEELFNQMAQVYDHLGEEWSVYASVSDTFIPNYLTIYEVLNEQKVRTYYDEQFLDGLSKMMKLMRGSIGDSPQMSMYDGAYIGNPIMHNGVEIKSFVFPNFSAALGDVPPDMLRMFPQAWEWSYAISDGLLYFAIGGQEQIKSALDSKGKIGESISENISYQKLIEKLGDNNNLLFGISPLNLAKGYMNLVARADPNVAAELQMISSILTGIPENYSIGISGKIHDGGIGAKLLIALGDFKQLIQTITMLSGMGQLQ